MSRKKKQKISKEEELLKSLEADKKFLLETQMKLADEINKISLQLAKNEGGRLILKKLLENK
jgi:hypothetical protein